jgi:hypothetical protein
MSRVGAGQGRSRRSDHRELHIRCDKFSTTCYTQSSDCRVDAEIFEQHSLRGEQQTDHLFSADRSRKLILEYLDIASLIIHVAFPILQVESATRARVSLVMTAT